MNLLGSLAIAQPSFGIYIIYESRSCLITTCWGSSSPPKIPKTKTSFVCDVRGLLSCRKHSRQRHCLKVKMMNVEATAEGRQLWLKVAMRIKHDSKSKRKRLVNPWWFMLRLCVHVKVINVFLLGLRPVTPWIWGYKISSLNAYQIQVLPFVSLSLDFLSPPSV